MTRTLLNIFLLLPFCIYSQNYKAEIDSLNSKASDYIHIDLDSAYYFAEQAIQKSKTAHYQKGEMDGQFQKGRILYDQARRTLSIEAGEKSLVIAEDLNNYEGKKNALNLIGKIQNHAKQYTEGLRTVRENYTLAKAENDSIEMALMTNFLGIFKNKLGEKDSAFYFTMQSVKINKSLNIKKALAYNYNSLGIHHYGDNNLDSAFFYFRTALKIRTNLKLPNQSIEAYNNLGYVFLMEKIPDSAIVYFQHCINTCLEYGKKHNLAIAYENIAKSYELNKNHKAALNALKKAIPINDSLTGIKQKEQIILAQKEKNEKLLIQQAIDKEQKEKQNALIILLTFVLILTFLILKKSKQRALEIQLEKEKTTAAKAIINEQERVREEIARDLHDGVGSSLAGVKLSLSNLQAENKSSALLEEIEHLEKTYQEIRNISHNLSPISFQKNSLCSTINNYLTRAFPDLKPEICFQCYPENELEKLIYDQKLCVYRIIQELATNIQKHSLATNVNFHLTGHKKYLTIMAEDNGKGFDPKTIKQGIGFNNIQKRITLYDGKIEIDSMKGNGTTIIIDIPYKKA